MDLLSLQIFLKVAEESGVDSVELSGEIMLGSLTPSQTAGGTLDDHALSLSLGDRRRGAHQDAAPPRLR